MILHLRNDFGCLAENRIRCQQFWDFVLQTQKRLQRTLILMGQRKTCSPTCTRLKRTLIVIGHNMRCFLLAVAIYASVVLSSV